MQRFAADARVRVHPFSRQEEGGEIIIGIVATHSFLSLPPDAIEIIDHLAAGETVGRARELYRERYAEDPDMEHFLGLLEQRGFLSLQHPDRASHEQTPSPVPVRHHFGSISQELSAALFGGTALRVYGLIIALALAAATLEPRIIPNRDSLYFFSHKAPLAISLFVLSYVMIFIHELAHLSAARALGLGARMGISNRLWFMVAETDLTGLWSVPRRERYVPFLAGPIVDAVSGSALTLVVFAAYRGWLALPDLLVRFLQALVFLYFLRLVWQCFFFVRTDFYYVIANFSSCRSLLADTERYLRGQLSRLGLTRRAEMPQLSKAEARAVRMYAPVWIFGRAVAFAVLFFVSLPLSYKYVTATIAGLRSGFHEQPYLFVDSLVFAVLAAGPFFVGLAFWLIGLVKKWSAQSETAGHPVR